jgi:hypothetical protein
VGVKRWTPLIVGVSVTGVFWVVGGSLLLASWRSGLEAERARDAPICADSQAFSGAECRATAAGMLTKLTSGEMDVTVDGRSISSAVTLSGQLPSTSPAIPVEVTIYRGRVIHIEGETNLSVDTDAAPSTKSVDYRNFGLYFLVFGGAVGIYSAVKTAQDRDEPGQDMPRPSHGAG